MLKLNPAVFYRKFADYVICYHTGRHKVMKFNAVVGDILDLLKKGADEESVCVEMGKLYDVARQGDFKKFISEFLSVLSENGIAVRSGHRDFFGSLENRLMFDMPDGQLNSVLIELTYRCSERCKHCYVIRSDENELTTDEVKSILSQLADMNVMYLTLTGGEPFLREDFCEILRYAYNKGFVTDIFSNGISISDDKYFSVAACHPRFVHFSLYSHIEEKHDAVTCVKGSFIKTLRSAQKFIALGVAVNIKTVVMEDNFDDVEGILSLAEKIGATVQVGFSVSPRNDSDGYPITLRVRDEERLERAMRASRDKIEEIEGVRNGKRDLDGYICGAGQSSVSINPQGMVFPCNALPIPLGSVKTTPIKEIWERSERLTEWRNNKFSMIKRCGECEKKDFCAFCPGTAMTEKGSPFLPYEEACRIAAIRKAMANNA